MGIFNNLKKDAEPKVERKQLKDVILKKKTYIVIGMSLFLATALLMVGLIFLNILPIFHKLKGDVYKTYNVGEEFCLEDECFYTLKDNGDSITGLAKYNLYVGYNKELNSSVYEEISKNDDNYGKQSSYTLWANTAQNKRFGLIDFYTKEQFDPGYWVENDNLKAKYGSSYPAFVYDENSNIYNYVSDYQTYLSNTLGYSSVTASLMNYEQAYDIGLFNYYGEERFIDEIGVPTWIYQTNYWLGFADSNTSIFGVDDTAFVSDNAGQKHWYGIRPVITVSKQDLNKTNNEEENNQTGKTYKVGDEFCLGTECFYTVKDNGDTVRALAKYNITTTTERQQNKINYTMAFSNTTYWNDGTALLSNYGESYPSNILDENARMWNTLKNYENYFKEDLELNSVVIDLLTYQESLDLGCESDWCTNAPAWVYSSPYWLGTAASNSSIYTIMDTGLLSNRLSTVNSLYGLRPALTINKADIKYIEPPEPTQQVKKHEIGEEFCLESECFYVIEDNGNSVKALAKYNLYVGNIFTQSNKYITIDSQENGYGLQNELAIGFNSTYPRIGTINYSSRKYWNPLSYPAFVYSSSSNLYQYIENYRLYIVNQLKVNIDNITLLSYEQALELGCSGSSCSSAPDWVTQSSYWLGSANSGGLYTINTKAGFYGTNNYDDNYRFGIRPVITISESDINKTFYSLSSDKYTIDNDNKTIDVNKEILGNIYPSDFTVTPSEYYVSSRNEDKLVIKKSNSNFQEEYIIKNYKLYSLSSSSYTVDDTDNTINLNNEIVNLNTGLGSNGYNYYDIISRISISPSTYSIVLNNKKLEVKDSNDKVVGEYNFKNYKLYNFTSSYYTINEEDKTIDLKDDIVNDISSGKFSLYPPDYTINISNDKLEIKNGNEVLGTYTYINVGLYKLTSSYYTIDKQYRTIDTKGEFLENLSRNLWKLSLDPYNFTMQLDGNKLYIKDNNQNTIETYTFTNLREKDPNAYKNAGFNDKNLYACVFHTKIYNIDPDYVLTDDELQDISYLSCNSMGITDTKGIEKLTGLQELELYDNEIESIDLYANTELRTLNLDKNKLTSINVGKNTKLEGVLLANNKLEKVDGLDNLESLGGLALHNNNLNSIDIHNNTNLYLLTLYGNSKLDKVKLKKGESINYKEIFNINEDIELESKVKDNSIASYKNGIIKALKKGKTTLTLSNENIKSIKEDSYNLGMYNSDEIEDWDEFEKNAYDDYFMKVDIEVIEDEIPDEQTPDKQDVSTTTKKTTQKAITNNAKTTTTTKKKNNKTTTKNQIKKQEEGLKDIQLTNPKIDLFTLILVKGTNRNIIVQTDNYKFTINGKNIKKVTGDVDLSFTIKPISESSLKNKIRSDGLVIEFNNQNNVIINNIDLEISFNDKLLKHINKNNIMLYKYKDNTLYLSQQKLNIEKNKLIFNIDSLDNYILTSNDIKLVNMSVNKVVVNKNIEDKNNYIIIISISLLLILMIIGYITYKVKEKSS